jgi:hypothetical protein
MGERGARRSRRGRSIALRGFLVALVVAVTAAVLPSAAGATGEAAPSGPDSSVPCTTTTPIAFGGRSTTGSIATAGADACFTFSAAGGDVVWFDLANPATNLPDLYVDFFSPAGVSTCAGPFTGASSCDVPSGGTGTWTFQVSDTGEDTGTFYTSIQRLDGGVGCRSIEVGKLKKGKIIGDAGSACFKVPIKTGDYFFARAAGVTKYLSPAMLMAYPDGSAACGGGTDTDYGCTLTQTGTATLLVFSSTVRGKFDLYLQKMTAPQHCPTTAVGFGGHIDLAKPGDVGCLTFDGTSGEDVQATLTRLSGRAETELFTSLSRPLGYGGCGWYGTSGGCTLDTTGQWTILIWDFNNDDSGTYFLNLTNP